MNNIVKDLLNGKSGDYIFPFFWVHGEDEKTLRKMINVIADANCKSVCIESRPHPDYCGDLWWRDMDIIIDEAKKRDLKIWILDDSHFPTGFANGKVKDAPLELRRQSIVTSFKEYKGKEKEITINLTKMFPPKMKISNFMAMTATKAMSKNSTVFDDDRIVSVTAISDKGEIINIPFGNTGVVHWHKPSGNYKVYVTGLSRNFGIHRDYINMMSKESVRILIDEVYEKHYAHYKDEFGKTILGFFSDEPELGNGFYSTGANHLGDDIDLPFSNEVEEELLKELGEDWKNQIIYLWNNEIPEKAAKVRKAFMDIVTKLVRKEFSYQIGEWCREHGVKYIGHIIEDNNAHTRTGMSLGHYFRGLEGQDMAGIDDIGGQVYPQWEDNNKKTFFGVRDGEFYHFTLGNLGASAAAIDPKKNGNSMCEIFGNYGWGEGVRLEKYLAEHFMVRGINHFVPHAFTGKEFPDPDCPPHFYAHGHNPQYRHFGSIVEYMNRVCTLISNGHRNSKVAILYNAELVWMGYSMHIQKPLRKLYEAQILADTIPLDALVDKERYNTSFSDKLRVNTQEYDVLVIPQAQFITKEMKEVIEELSIPVIFIDTLPKVLEEENSLNYLTVRLEDLANEVRKHIGNHLAINPASKYVRILDYTNESNIYYLVNEDKETYEGDMNLDLSKSYYVYDAWNNKVSKLESNHIVLEPSKSLIIIEDELEDTYHSELLTKTGEKHTLNQMTRSICKSIEYPNFKNETEIQLPDNYATVDKMFSGFIRYEKEIDIAEVKKTILEITDAYEGVEVFVNDVSLGIQVVPTFLYDLTNYLQVGKNKIVIEVATSLERQMSKDGRCKATNMAVGNPTKIVNPIGINGVVNLYVD